MDANRLPGATTMMGRVTLVVEAIDGLDGEPFIDQELMENRD